MKYDEEKFHRLRNRRAMLQNEVQLLGDDVREHRRIRNALRSNVQHLKEHYQPPRVFLEHGKEVGRDPDTLPGIKEKLEKAETLLTAATQFYDKARQEADTMGSLVSGLETAIVQEWHLKLPPDPRLHKPSARLVLAGHRGGDVL